MKMRGNFPSEIFTELLIARACARKSLIIIHSFWISQIQLHKWPKQTWFTKRYWHVFLVVSPHRTTGHCLTSSLEGSVRNISQCWWNPLSLTSSSVFVLHIAWCGYGSNTLECCIYKSRIGLSRNQLPETHTNNLSGYLLKD